MQLQEFLLTKLAEELVEVVKNCTKALTFGMNSVAPRNGKTNLENIGEEINDVIVIVKLLREDGVVIPGIGDPSYIQARTQRALEGASEAYKSGIISDIQISVEEGAQDDVPGDDPVAAFLNALNDDTDAAAERMARMFHNTYERLAPDHGYETREETRTFDPNTPNGKLMIATCMELLRGKKPEVAPPVPVATEPVEPVAV